MKYRITTFKVAWIDQETNDMTLSKISYSNYEDARNHIEDCKTDTMFTEYPVRFYIVTIIDGSITEIATPRVM